MFGSLFDASASIGVPSIDDIFGLIGTVLNLIFS